MHQRRPRPDDFRHTDCYGRLIGHHANCLFCGKRMNFLDHINEIFYYYSILNVSALNTTKYVTDGNSVFQQDSELAQWHLRRAT